MSYRLAVAALALPCLLTTARAAEPQAFTCDSDLLGRKASDKSLAKTFGAANVQAKKDMDSEGSYYSATHVHVGKGREILDIEWFDPPARLGPHVIWTEDKTYWVGPRGVHVGMALAELEAANGKPFEFWSPSMDLGAGEVSDWKGGALHGVMKACGFQVTLGPTIDKTKEMVLMSNDPKVRASKFTIIDMRLVFDYPDGK
jgi:hypothetical protein